MALFYFYASFCNIWLTERWRDSLCAAFILFHIRHYVISMQPPERSWCAPAISALNKWPRRSCQSDFWDPGACCPMGAASFSWCLLRFHLKWFLVSVDRSRGQESWGQTQGLPLRLRRQEGRVWHIYPDFSPFSQSHRRQHNKDKPFKCHNCHRAYTDATSLEVHLSTHTVKHAKVYTCTICSRAYTSVSTPPTPLKVLHRTCDHAPSLAPTWKDQEREPK